MTACRYRLGCSTMEVFLPMQSQSGWLQNHRDTEDGCKQSTAAAEWMEMKYQVWQRGKSLLTFILAWGNALLLFGICNLCYYGRVVHGIEMFVRSRFVLFLGKHYQDEYYCYYYYYYYSPLTAAGAAGAGVNGKTRAAFAPSKSNFYV